MRIDAHQHFWQINRGDYGWLTPDLDILYKDYLPENLHDLMVRCQIDGTVLVQAAPTVNETHYMLSLADEYDFIKGVVGWIDFESNSAIDQLNQLSKHPKLKGVRPMIQDIADPEWMLSKAFDPVYTKLVEWGLCFDALVLPSHLPSLLVLLKRYSNLKAVIDHGAKPKIADGEFDDWADGMKHLADETDAFCKVSGLWTEAGGDISAETILPYITHLLKCFGPKRLMWGSDWPVLNLAGDYGDWFAQVQAIF